MNSKPSDLDHSLHLQDVLSIKEDETVGGALPASVSSEIVLPSFRGKRTAVATDKHKHQAYCRPEEWLGAVPTGSRSQMNRSWRPKVSSSDESNHDSVHSAPAMLQSRRTPKSSQIKTIVDRTQFMMPQSSLHGSFTFQDLVVATKDSVGFDESQHSVLTEEENQSKSSKFTNLLKMWNSATSLGPSVVDEEDDEDSSKDTTFVEVADAKEATMTHSSSFKNTRNTPWTSTATVDGKHLRTQDLGDSYGSSTSATDSITTWKSFGSDEQRRRLIESLSQRHQPVRYLHTGNSGASGSVASTSSSACSSHHGHRGHNRPDDWVGGCKSKPAKRSWRPKTTVATSD